MVSNAKKRKNGSKLYIRLKNAREISNALLKSKLFVCMSEKETTEPNACCQI